MEDRILTRHPQGKQGVNIERKKYEQMRTLILELLSIHSPIGFTPLMKIVEREISGSFDGSVSWYFTTVKLDLEARGELLRKKIKGKEVLVMPANA